MRTFIIACLLFAVYAFFGRWYYVCQIKGLCEETTTVIEETPPVSDRPTTLSIKHNGTLILSGYEEFAFELGKAKPDMSDNNAEFLERLAAEMVEKPDMVLRVKSKYRASENKPFNMYENLGIARFAWLEGEMEDRGISGKRIISNFEKMINDDLAVPFQFEFINEIPKGTSDVSYTVEDMTYQFAFGSKEFTPSGTFKAYTEQLTSYFSENPNKKLMIIGHTDDVGEPANNLQLGLDRANEVKNWLESNTTLDIEITADSKGESQPIAPNLLSKDVANEAGRQKNRRINFVITDQE